MVVSRAYARYIRVSPRKVRQVIDLIRGEKVNRALAILASINKGARGYVVKLLSSALKNAQQNPTVKADELFISKITADNGPMLKRYRAAAMGRATTIRRRTTHLSVELAKIKEKQAKKSNQRPKGVPSPVGGGRPKGVPSKSEGKPASLPVKKQGRQVTRRRKIKK